MSDPIAAPLGIFRCRDLVTLFYGVRMVADVVEKNPDTAFSSPALLIGLDARRIDYELIFLNEDTTAAVVFLGNTIDAIDVNGPQYQIPPGDTIRINRNWLAVLDAVTMPVFWQTSSASIVGTTRETFLTPTGIDEPLLEP